MSKQRRQLTHRRKTQSHMDNDIQHIRCVHIQLPLLTKKYLKHSLILTIQDKYKKSITYTHPYKIRILTKKYLEHSLILTIHRNYRREDARRLNRGVTIIRTKTYAKGFYPTDPREADVVLPWQSDRPEQRIGCLKTPFLGSISCPVFGPGKYRA